MADGVGDGVTLRHKLGAAFDQRGDTRRMSIHAPLRRTVSGGQLLSAVRVDDLFKACRRRDALDFVGQLVALVEQGDFPGQLGIVELGGSQSRVELRFVAVKVVEVERIAG